MSTTKSQKVWMVLISILALVLGFVVLVPFKSVSNASNIFLIEMLVKLVAIPVIILLISVFPNKLKYIQVKGYREQSRIVSVISYFPAVVYLCALISESIYLLAQGYVLNGSAPLGTIPWNLWYVALIVDLVIFMIAVHIFPKYEEQLDVKEHIILDACVFVLIVCFGLMYLLVSKGTNEVFAAAGKQADPLLLVLYICAVSGFICEVGFISKTVKTDEVNINIHLGDLKAVSFAARTAEYNRAYNDIMANFEQYFVEDGEIDIQEVELVDEDEEETLEEPQEEQQAEEVQEGQSAEETQEEQTEEAAPAEEAQPVEEAQEAQPAEEAQEAQPAEEPQETEQAKEAAPVQNEELEKKQEEAAQLEAEIEQLRQAKEAEAQAKAEAEAAKIAAREEAARLAEEKALKNKEEMQPTFAKLVAHAKALEGVSCVEDGEKRQARFLINRKVFLIMTDTDKDYRLQFVNDPLKVVSWWAENSEIRPRSNKVDNWFKLTNKGTFTEELLFTIIDSSCEFMASEQKRIAEEKKAQKAAAKQAAKEAAAKEAAANAEANK